MKRICAWHPQNFGFERIMEYGTEPATHGMCSDCSVIEEVKLNRFRQEGNAQFSKPLGWQEHTVSRATTRTASNLIICLAQSFNASRRRLSTDECPR